jgi:hypothetical protein
MTKRALAFLTVELTHISRVTRYSSCDTKAATVSNIANSDNPLASPSAIPS